MDHQTSFEKFLFLMNFYSNPQISFIFQGLDIVKLNNKKNLLLTFIHHIKNYEPVVYENRDTSLYCEKRIYPSPLLRSTKKALKASSINVALSLPKSSTDTLVILIGSLITETI